MLTTYSGVLNLEYGTASAKFAPEQFVHPLCFIAERPLGSIPPTAFPPGLPPKQEAFLLPVRSNDGFKGATATVALASLWTKQTDAVASILTATADLWSVDIGLAAPALQQLLACLSVVVQGRQSHIYSVGYRVDVLTVVNGYGAPIPIKDRPTGPNEWDGVTFNTNRGGIVAAGQPQRP
ncbi:hypothetical protein ACQR16_08970 [Bradyrhizobium oligotrophicum]|uniref:hypothetical protein n=1 Tax=Bradyrhizobium oligotrophicum TaxID=44255 RepID=UPI003EC084BA